MDKTALTFPSPYIKKALRHLKISDPLSFIRRLSQDKNLWHHRELEDKALQRTRETKTSGSSRELCNFQIITHVLFFEHLTSLLWTKTSSFILLITSVSYCDVIILEEGRQKTEIIQVGVRVTEGSKCRVLINYYFPGPQVVQGLSTEAGILETKSLSEVVW